MTFEQWIAENLDIPGNNNIPESMRPRPAGRCKDTIADILADYAEKIRALEPSDDYSLARIIHKI
jgi:hypothetical protein